MMKKNQIQDAMKLVKYPSKIKSVLVCFVLAILFTNCKDFLNVVPEDVLTQQEFWKTKSDVMSVVAATYDAARENTAQSFAMGEVRADFVTVPDNDYAAIANNNISTTNNKVRWGGYYNVINLANTVMYFAPLVAQDQDKTLTTPIVNQIKSEMLFLRSLSYFYLVRLWKDVPLVLRPTISDTVDFYLPKSTEAEVLNQLVTDLKLANSLGSSDASDKGHANKYAIQALLADVYLWKEDYKHCIDYCDSIMLSGKFDLEPDSLMFNLYYPGNSQIESIFEIQYNFKLKEYSNINWGSIVVDTKKMLFDDNDKRQFGARTPKWKYTGADLDGMIARTAVEIPNYIYYRYADVLMMKAEALVELSEANLTVANDMLKQLADRAGENYIPSYSRVDFRTAQLAERGRESGAEGKRWFDLLRVAKRNSFQGKQFLADILLSKAKTTQELNIMKSKVIDSMSYFLPIYEDEIKFNQNLEQNTAYTR